MNEDHLQEAIESISEVFNDPQRRAAWLLERAEVMEIDPPVSPRTKRRSQSPETALRKKAERAGLWAAKYPFLRSEALDPLMDIALASENPSKIVNAISKGTSKAQGEPVETQFSRHVILAIRAAARIMQKENRMPTLGQVRGLVGLLFEEAGWNDFWTEPQRWTEVFSAAGLSDLDRSKPARDANKHGEFSRSKRMQLRRKE